MRGYKIIGIFGCPVSHSLSPLMHNAAIEHLGLDYIYLPFEVKPESLGDAVRAIKALGLCGVNITIPHKEKIIQYLDRLAPEAELMGAVNTVALRNGELCGYNTDGFGLIASIKAEAGIDVKGKKIFILGAGGAARAACVALAIERAAEIIVANRTADRAVRLAEYIASKIPQTTARAIPLAGGGADAEASSADLIINATSVGMSAGDAPLLGAHVFGSHHLVCDMVYNPRTTALLESAKRGGARAMNGLGMLIYQGARSFEMWTGCKMPIDVVKRELEAKMAAL